MSRVRGAPPRRREWSDNAPFHCPVNTYPMLKTRYYYVTAGGKVEAEASGKEGDSKEEGEESKEESGKEEGGGEEAEEEEAEAKPVIEIRTSAYDARFPSTNQVICQKCHAMQQRF